MNTIVFAICFGIVSVCLGDSDTTEDGNSWPSICLEDIGNSSCTGNNLTNLKWRFNNVKKDCHPDLICPESKNRFESERECENACLHVDKMCSCIRQQEDCEGKAKFWAWNYDGKTCTKNEHCRRTMFDFTSEKQCKTLCMKQQYSEECCLPEPKINYRDSCDLGDFEQRWYFDGRRCRSFAYFNCSEDGGPIDPEMSDKGNNFFSIQQCKIACMSSNVAPCPKNKQS
uniref:Putative salivary kunitz domain protein n=1 Tax=Ixodes ricinus TaxID=34613 RepID=A0A0K8R328_IXORI